MKQPVRITAAVVIVTLAAVCPYYGFSIFRDFVEEPPARTTNFTGKAVVFEDRVNGIRLTTRGLWNREIIIRIPPSGLLPVRSMEPFHTMCRQKVILADGTLIDDGTPPSETHPSRFRILDGPGEPLAKSLAGIDCLTFELAATPRFKEPHN